MFQVLINIVVALHVFVSLLLLLVVLMQRPKSEGLGAAFGGGMTENIFGAQTTHVLSRLTVWLGGAFFAITLLLAILYAKQSNTTSSLTKALQDSEPASIQSATPADEATPADAGSEAAAKEIPSPAVTEVPKAPETPKQASTTEVEGTAPAKVIAETPVQAVQEKATDTTDTEKSVAPPAQSTEATTETVPAAAESTPAQ